MKKGHYIDNAIKIICGGEETDESAVWRDDVASLLPAAVNFGLQAAQWDQFKKEGDYDLPGAFIGSFPCDLDRTDPDYPTFTVPGTNLITLSSDRALRMVYTQKGFGVYRRMNDNMFANWAYYSKILVDQRFFRLRGMTGTLFNANPLETAVYVDKIVLTEDYNDLDEFPVPAGQELIVIQQLVKLFQIQRNTPADPFEDGADINE